MTRYIIKLITKVIDVVTQLVSIRTMIDHQRSIAYNDSQHFIYARSGLNTKIFSDHWELRDYCLEHAPKSGKLLEFGVYKGKSINHLARLLSEKSDDRTIIGFDSFRGFSEEWTGVDKQYDKIHFDQSGILPKVESNVELIDGFIEESLPKYLEGNQVNDVAFIHIDTDTYTPAKVTLSLLKRNLKSGSIILFDELCGYPNWRNHEYKALSEVFDDDEYEFLGFAQSQPRAQLIKAAIRII